MNRTTTPARLLPALFALVALVPTCSLAGTETQILPGWYSRFPTGTGSNVNNIFMTVDAVSETLVYLGGLYMDATDVTTLMKMQGVAFRSQDAGANIQDIDGGAGGIGGTMASDTFCTLSSIKAFRASESERPAAWALCGGFIGYSPEGAGFSDTFDAPAVGEDKDTFTVLHLFDGTSGVVGAKSGNVYLFELAEDGKSVAFTPAAVDNLPPEEHSTAEPEINAMFWLSGKVGWAVATDSLSVTEQDYEGTETTVQSYYDSRVFKTTDGGKNWTLLSTISLPNEDDVHTVTLMGYTGPLTFDGGWYAKDIFMVDENEGFLALMAYDNEKEMAVVAKLLHTADGGKNWTDCRADMQIGTMTSMIAQGVYINEIAGMYFWKGEDGTVRGRVAGSAFLIEGGSSGGNPPKYYTVAVASTTDGGTTWTKLPDISTCTYDWMSGGAPSCSTARMISADFTSPYTGFGVGDKGTVFRFQYKCTKHSECEFGYYCNPDRLTCLSCSEIALTDKPSAIEKCSTWTPPPEDTELGSRDAWEAGDDGTTTLVDAEGGRDLSGWNGGSGDGCSAGSSGSGLSVVILMVLAGLCALAARMVMRPKRLE